MKLCFAASIGVLIMTGCASAPIAPARTARSTSMKSAPRRPALRAERAALPSVRDGDSDCVFLQNAALAIEQYQAFIQRAGSAQEFATALERSRNEVTDLQAEMDFVRSGMAQRGAHCGST